MVMTVKSAFTNEKYHRNGNEVLTYIALLPISCYKCERIIQPKELFSRSANKSGTKIGIRYTFCRDCMPFEKCFEHIKDKIKDENKEKEQRIKQSKERENKYKDLKDLNELAPVEDSATFKLDKNGQVLVSDEDGYPMTRDEVIKMIIIARQYLDLYSAEEIEDIIEAQIEDQRKNEKQFKEKYLDELIQRATEEATRKNKKKGHIYFLQGDECYKIGKSKNCYKRVKLIETELPFKVSLRHVITTNDIDKSEHYWHSKFKSKRLNGEWFNLSAEDIEQFLSVNEMIF